LIYWVIEKIGQKIPVIVYIDKYYLDKIYHYSHFVILKSINNKTSVILDPWDAKERKVETRLLIRAIQSLRNKPKVSPKVIRVL